MRDAVVVVVVVEHVAYEVTMSERERCQERPHTREGEGAERCTGGGLARGGGVRASGGGGGGGIGSDITESHMGAGGVSEESSLARV